MVRAQHPVKTHVINGIVMKVTIYILLFVFLQSCSSTKQVTFINEDYTIAQLALNHFSKWSAYRLVQTPSTHTSDSYLKGFSVWADIEFYQKFSYSGSGREKWKKFFFKDEKIKAKLTIIKDFDKVEKVSHRDMDRVKTYISMSRPLYSEDGEVAVIIINSFSNIGLNSTTGHGLVFEKKNGEWKLYLEYVPYIS